MRSLSLLTLGVLVAIGSSAGADTPDKTGRLAAAAPKAAKMVTPAKMTCEDFLSYDEVSRPQIVYLTEGLNRKGKPEEAVIDVERINSLVPMLVEDCKKSPHASYWKKMKERFDIS